MSLSPSTGRHIWVGNIRSDVDVGNLWNSFSRFGEVEDIHTHKAPTGGDCWAVVSYRHRASAAAALAGLNPQQPLLTWKFLKLREWVEDSPRSWRRSPSPQYQQQYPKQHPRSAEAAAWADAEDEEPPPPPGQRWQPWQQQQTGGWGSAAGPRGADHEEWGEDEEAGWDEEAEEEDDDEYDPLVELWVGNLWSGATRRAIRRAFECFGEVHGEVRLQAAPGGMGLQFAFVQLPASAAQSALEELDGLCVYELSGDLRLKVKQSSRSLKPLLRYQQRLEQRQQQRQQQGQAAAALAAAGAAGQALEVACEDGGVARLQAPRSLKKMVVCEGPPSRTLWVGNVSFRVSEGTLTGVFHRYGSVMRARLFPAPGFQNNMHFAFVEMGSASEAQRARSALQGEMPSELCNGKPLKLRYAWPPSRVHPAGTLAAGAGAGAAAGSIEAPASSPQANGSGGSSGSVSEAAGEAAGERAAAAAAAVAAAAPLRAPPGPRCAACGVGPEAGLRRCSQCHAVYYCSRDCQLADWDASHARECHQLQQLGGALQQPGASAEALRLLLAALQQQPAGGRQLRLVQATLEKGGPAAQSGAAPPLAAAAQ